MDLHSKEAYINTPLQFLDRPRGYVVVIVVISSDCTIYCHPHYQSRWVPTTKSNPPQREAPARRV